MRALRRRAHISEIRLGQGHLAKVLDGIGEVSHVRVHTTIPLGILAGQNALFVRLSC